MPADAKNEQEKDAGDSANAARCDTVPEKVTLWVSILIVLALFVFLGFHSWHAAHPSDSNATPRVTVRIDGAKAQAMDSAHWCIPLTVRNTGNLAMEDVLVQVTLRGKDGKEKTTDLSFAYLAEGASDDAFVVSETPPDQARPEASVTAFKTQRRARGY